MLSYTASSTSLIHLLSLTARTNTMRSLNTERSMRRTGCLMPALWRSCTPERQAGRQAHGKVMPLSVAVCMRLCRVSRRHSASWAGFSGPHSRQSASQPQHVWDTLGSCALAPLLHACAPRMKQDVPDLLLFPGGSVGLQRRTLACACSVRARLHPRVFTRALCITPGAPA